MARIQVSLLTTPMHVKCATPIPFSLVHHYYAFFITTYATHPLHKVDVFVILSLKRASLSSASSDLWWTLFEKGHPWVTLP
jgi:hypothetical protein